MHIAILGAAGRTGKILVEQAVKAGHSVTTFSRHQDGPATAYISLTTLVGDARKEDDLNKALQGQDAVISTLGSNRPNDPLMKPAMEALIRAAKTQGVRRVIVMSSFMVTSNFRPKGITKFLAGLLKNMVSDKIASEELLMQSGLDWTIIHATTLTNGALSGKVRVVSSDELVGLSHSISRTDVAEFLLSELHNTTHIRQKVLITNKG